MSFQIHKLCNYSELHSPYKIAILFECKHKLKNDPLDHFLICMATESNFAWLGIVTKLSRMNGG